MSTIGGTEIVAEKIVVDFQEVLAADGRAAKTLESYIGDVRAFLHWLEVKGNAFTGNIKRFHITSYRNYIVHKDLEINTINKKINSGVIFSHLKESNTALL